jgi:hypothetical protein
MAQAFIDEGATYKSNPVLHRQPVVARYYILPVPDFIVTIVVFAIIFVFIITYCCNLAHGHNLYCFNICEILSKRWQIFLTLACTTQLSYHPLHTNA